MSVILPDHLLSHNTGLMLGRILLMQLNRKVNMLPPYQPTSELTVTSQLGERWVIIYYSIVVIMYETLALPSSHLLNCHVVWR